MRSPLDTNSLPPDLAARFAALRTPSAAPSPALDEAPTSPLGAKKDTPKDFPTRLSRLETPTKGDKEGKVPVQVKTPDGSFGAGQDDEDDAVTAFLAAASSSPPPLHPLSTSPGTSPTRTASYRQKLPLPSPSALDTLSGIEVQFIKRPSLGGVGALGGDAGGGEEEDLLKRMGEEVELERRVEGRNEERVEGWEKRLEGLKKGVVLPPSSSSAASSPSPGNLMPLSSQPPELGELQRAMRRRARKKKARGVGKEEDSDGEGETSSEEETTSEEETESEEKSEEEP